MELENRYMITSNRESGFGRYDVMLEPRNKIDDAMILEFKVQDSDEKSLEDTVKAASKQIDEKQYAVSLIEKGVPESHIRKYGFAFLRQTGSDRKIEFCHRKSSYVHILY